MVRRAGYRVGGILSKALFTDGVKTGISAVDLGAMEAKTLARLRKEGDSLEPGQETGCWVFNESVLEWGNTILAYAVPCDLLIVDELGPLEWVHGRGWLNGLSAIDSANYHIALVPIRPELLTHGIARWNPIRVVEIGRGKSLPVESVYQMVIDRLPRPGSAAP